MMPEARTATPVLEAEAIRLARELYSLECTARRLPGEYDDNFYLQASTGAAFVLKVMHAAREQSFLEMQCAAFRHLERQAPHLALPRVHATRGGQPLTRITREDGEQTICLDAHLDAGDRTG